MLLDRAVAAAMTLAALSPAAFALTKRQTRQPALERLDRAGRTVDAEVEEIWTAPETLERIRDYVARTLRKSEGLPAPGPASTHQTDLAQIALHARMDLSGLGAAASVFCGVVSRPCSSRLTSAACPRCSARAKR